MTGTRETQAEGLSRLKRKISSVENGWFFYALVESFLFFRGVVFVGRRYACPCCGWRVRAFTTGGLSFKTRALSYCPRCHAKSRHRRAWLFLEERTDLFRRPHRLLHVSPEYCLSRRLSRMPGIAYTGADLWKSPHASVQMEPAAIPFQAETFDGVIALHVLEHVGDDRAAMRELRRVLKTGGWAVISVPVRLDQPTFEDPSITTPQGREIAYGETAHLRLYGYDLADRLRDAGFQVEVDIGTDVAPEIRRRYGLRDSETIFYCRKS